MAFTQSTWYDAPNPNTPVSAARLNDLEARIAAAVGGISVIDSTPAVRAYNSADIVVTTGTLTPIPLDTNRYDVDSQHYTSVAALTGTLAKTSGSAAVVGTGTAFTTQLSIGQVFDLPGTATERRVVTSITDDTHLTVNATYANTASGQTGTRNNSSIVARTAGVYHIFVNVRFAAGGTGRRQLKLAINPAPAASGGTVIASDLRMAVTDAITPTDVVAGVDYKLAQWDYVEAQVFHAQGTNLNITSIAAQSPEVGMHRVSAG